MTSKKHAMHRFAAVAAVLLALCLVFMMPAEAAADCTAGNTCTDHVAAIGNTHYDSLQEAVIAVTTDKQTEIDLLRDATGPGVMIGNGTSYLCDCASNNHNDNCSQATITNNQNIIIDFNGHTYTAEYGIGSSGTTTTAFQLLKDSSVVLKNGKISSNSSYQNVKRLIQNYADLRLENMVLDGSNLGLASELTDSNLQNAGNHEKASRAVVSICNGDVTLVSTTIKSFANEGGYPICLYYWPCDRSSGSSTGYGPLSLTIASSDVAIEGTIIYGHSNVMHDKYQSSYTDKKEELKKAITVTIPKDYQLTPQGYYYMYDVTDWTVTPNQVTPVASVGEKKYIDIYDAVAAAKGGKTVTVLEDVTLTDSIMINDGMDVTIEGSDKTITGGSGKDVFCVKGGKLTLSAGLNVYAPTDCAIYIRGGEVITSANLKKEGEKYSVIQGNGQYTGDVTINGGTITNEITDKCAIYWPQNGKLTINGGTITGGTPLRFVSGSLEITGGEFIANGKSQQYVTSNGASVPDTGDAIMIENIGGESGYESPNPVSILGGVFKSANAAAVGSYADKGVSAITGFITGGTFSSDVSDYVAEDCICIQEAASTFVVQKKSENTVVPEVPATSETKTENGKTTTTLTPENDSTVETKTENGVTTVTIAPSETSESAVTITITGADVSVDTNKQVTVPESATIKAEYKEAEAKTEDTSAQANAVTFTLSVNIDNVTKPLPVIDASMLTEEKKKTVKDNSGKQIKKFLAAITALGDNDKNGVNGNLKGNDAVTIVIKVHKSLVDNPHLMAALHLDKDGKPKQGSNPKLTLNEEEDNYVVTITGDNFSSYVLVEEEPQQYTGGGSATDTGSGNYQYYPRSVPADGIVSFGTSKVITGMELPAGSDGTVTLNIKPTFAMPENGFYAFEIDAPGYNTDAKINGGLSFQISVADLEAAGFTAEDIVLFHGTVGEDGKIVWEALPTNLVKNENGIAYYKAVINGCSPFYIGFVEDGSIINTEAVDPVTPPTETPETPVTPDEPEILPPADEPQDKPTEEPATPAPVLAVLAGLGAVAVLRRK